MKGIIIALSLVTFMCVDGFLMNHQAVNFPNIFGSCPPSPQCMMSYVDNMWPAGCAVYVTKFPYNGRIPPSPCSYTRRCYVKFPTASNHCHYLTSARCTAFSACGSTMCQSRRICLQFAPDKYGVTPIRVYKIEYCSCSYEAFAEEMMGLKRLGAKVEFTG